MDSLFCTPVSGVVALTVRVQTDRYFVIDATVVFAAAAAGVVQNTKTPICCRGWYFFHALVLCPPSEWREDKSKQTCPSGFMYHAPPRGTNRRPTFLLFLSSFFRPSLGSFLLPLSVPSFLAVVPQILPLFLPSSLPLFLRPFLPPTSHLVAKRNASSSAPMTTHSF